MTVPLWVTELASSFWEAAGDLEPFPRGLRRPIARALPVAVISLPRLRLSSVRDWLIRNSVGCPCASDDRGLRACLAARDGYGYIFLDGTDAEDEQRLSLAHELAHFLRHYSQPRQRAQRRLSDQMTEVLDGRRQPTFAEQVHAMLAGVPIGFHLHLMDRESGAVGAGAIDAAEQEADRLAYELLAPADEVARNGTDAKGHDRRDSLSRLLRTAFGLPASHADRYARLLLPPPGDDPILERLGLIAP